MIVRLELECDSLYLQIVTSKRREKNTKEKLKRVSNKYLTRRHNTKTRNLEICVSSEIKISIQMLDKKILNKKEANSSAMCRPRANWISKPTTSTTKFIQRINLKICRSKGIKAKWRRLVDKGISKFHGFRLGCLYLYEGVVRDDKRRGG